MKPQFGCSLAGAMERGKIEETCCLHALGELPLEESNRWEEHLRECQFCRALTMEYKQIMLFDLPAIAVTRSECNMSEDSLHINEREVLASVRERAVAVQQRLRNHIVHDDPSRGIIPSKKRRIRLWQSATLVGWAVAAGLLLASVVILPLRRVHQAPAVSAPKYVLPTTDAAALEVRIVTAEQQVKQLETQFMQSEAEVRTSQAAYSRLSSQSHYLANANSTLEAQLTENQGKLAQESAELELTRQNLNDQIADRDSLRVNLTDVNDRLEREKSEVARLERVALSTTTHFPVSDQPLGDSEAKEILGARDLHIVDVYDVDNSGKSSRAYGRIYFVNRTDLIFYAFDLSKLESDHKVVAFQAWGFRQPQSSKVESLGLFFLENATLNRWTLRVSDPQILSRIDSLFVTAEPPGGSRFPKGKRLLMASLAGPPNHP